MSQEGNGLPPALRLVRHLPVLKTRTCEESRRVRDSGGPRRWHRDDCPQERPCPRINCKDHLWHIEGGDMPGRRYVDDEQYDETPPPNVRANTDESCAIDLANRGPRPVKEIAEALGMTPRRVQQLLAELLKRDDVSKVSEVAAWVRNIKGDGR